MNHTFGLNPTVVISFKASPVLTKAILIGIYPMEVANRNVEKGIPMIAADIFMNQLGTIGVTLMNNVYQNKFFFSFSTATYTIILLSSSFTLL